MSSVKNTGAIWRSMGPSLRDDLGFRLAGLAPSQGPQAAHCEDKGEQAEDAQRVQRPNEQEGWAGPGDRAVEEACWAHGVHYRHADRNERPDKHDDVARPAVREQ